MSSTVDYFTVTVKCTYCNSKIPVEVSRTQDNVTGETHDSPQDADCYECGSVIAINSEGENYNV